MDSQSPTLESFTMVATPGGKQIYDHWRAQVDGKTVSLHTCMLGFLRDQYPELCITACLTNNVALIPFANSGNAICELDTKTESVERFRYFFTGNHRRGIPDTLLEGRTFAKYRYVWNNEYYLLYVVTVGFMTVWQYILKEPDESKGESVISQPATSDALIKTVGKWMEPDDNYVYVFDHFWTRSRQLWEEVGKAQWEDVILKEDMKKQLVELMKKFFESKEIYQELGVPWKRGVIFHGPVGNGKTISIKALMHSLSKYQNPTVPALYVKSAPYTWNIRDVFVLARAMAPCMLILEDIDTIVTRDTRSYFFNEVDGLENNDGIFMVASTNHLDQLDPGLASRPSRFDRKYLFPDPDEGERTLYCKYWRKKLAKKQSSIKFPSKLCPAIAGITQDFSFAYLKEAFVATLLTIAGRRSEDEIIDVDDKGIVDLAAKKNVLGGGPDDGDGDDDDDDKPLQEYELWREMKKTVAMLRDDIGKKKDEATADGDNKASGGGGSGSTARGKRSTDPNSRGAALSPLTVTDKFGEMQIDYASGNSSKQKAIMFGEEGRLFAQGDIDMGICNNNRR